MARRDAPGRHHGAETLVLSEPELCTGWRAGATAALGVTASRCNSTASCGAEPHLENGDAELWFTHRLTLPGGGPFRGRGEIFHPPAAAGAGGQHVLPAAQRAAAAGAGTSGAKAGRAGPQAEPPAADAFAQDAVEPRRGLGRLCVAHPAAPQFVFELLDERSGCGCWPKASATRASGSGTATNGRPRSEQASGGQTGNSGRPPARSGDQWLRQLDWFMPEPGLWVGTPMKIFSARWPALGRAPGRGGISRQPGLSPAFLQPRQLPRLVVKGSGIDWLAVSAEWEAEGLKLSKADLERLAAATSRFVKLPNSGWVELDTAPFRARMRPWPTWAWITGRRAPKSRHGARRPSRRK